MTYVDLFAGAGGWDLAAESLGMDGVGIEIDPVACATREAAGLRTVQASVSDPMSYACAEAQHAQGLIASPPCTTFSAAGNGSGRAEMDKVLAAVRNWDTAATFADPRTALILEPLRWILNRAAAERPYAWIAMEQVPPVLPIWREYAVVLESLGYATAVGCLQAEMFGTPQTRKRAILMAHREHQVELPTPTHSRYHNRDPQRLDAGVLPWVSIAEALGWDGNHLSMGDVRRSKGTVRRSSSPSPSLTASMDNGDFQVVSNYGTGGDPTNRGVRTGDEPAATVTEKVGRNKVVLRNNTSANAAIRDEDQPAPTIYFGNRMNGVYFAGAGAGVCTCCTCEEATCIECDDLSATHLVGCANLAHVNCPLDAKVGGAWKIHAPGDRHGPNESGSHVRRVTVAEASVLQGFPVDHPWQGTKTAQYTQVGNAIPVQLAQAILRTLTDPFMQGS